MKKRLLLFLILSLLSFTLADCAAEPSSEAIIGLWVVRFNLATPEEIDKVLTAAGEAGITDLFAQVCGRAEAYYVSDLLPTADGVVPGFDPLDYLLTRAHDEGIRVHAWLNAFTAANRGKEPSSAEHVVYQHPEWVQTDYSGRSLLEYKPSEGSDVPAIFLDPGVPEVKDYVAAVAKELVEKYPIDGIHLDYIRYPGPAFGYSASSREAFALEFGWDPLGMSAFVQEARIWDAWRQRQVTETVKLVGSVLDQSERSILYSAAVFYDLDKARAEYFQDWPAWVTQGLVDFVVPMAYFDRQDRLELALDRILSNVGTARVYPGIGAYKLVGKTVELSKQINSVSTRGFTGMVLFEYQTMADGGLFTVLN